MLPRGVGDRVCVFYEDVNLKADDDDEHGDYGVKRDVGNRWHGLFDKMGRVVGRFGWRSLDGVEEFGFKAEQRRTRAGGEAGVRHVTNVGSTGKSGVAWLGNENRGESGCGVAPANVVPEAPQAALDTRLDIVGVTSKRDVDDGVRAVNDANVGFVVPTAAAVSGRVHGHELVVGDADDDVLGVKRVVVAGHAVKAVQEVVDEVMVDGGLVDPDGGGVHVLLGAVWCSVRHAAVFDVEVKVGVEGRAGGEGRVGGHEV